MKKKLLCDSCDADFTVTYKRTTHEIKCCPFCGDDIDAEWNSSDEDEDSTD